jgi:hypothetical protein
MFDVRPSSPADMEAPDQCSGSDDRRDNDSRHMVLLLERVS